MHHASTGDSGDAPLFGRPSTASGGYLTAEDEDSSRPSSATTTVAVTADNVSRTSSLDAPRLSVLSQPSAVWPPLLADEQPPRSSSPTPASRPQSSAGARVRGGGGSSLVGDWRSASAAPAAPPAGSSLRASVANIASPADFPPVPERGHRERHSRPTAVVESDEDDDPATLRRQSLDVFTDAVDDGDEDGDDVAGMPMPMPWRNLGPRPLSRDPEMEARKAAQEVKALTQEDEALIMRMSLPMRPLSLRPATAAGGFAGSASSNGHVRSPPAPRLPPVSAAPASHQQRGYVSAMEWGWATDDVAAPAHHGGATQLPPRVSRGAGSARSSSGAAAIADVAARASMSRGDGRRLSTPPRAAAVPQPAPAMSPPPPPRVRVPPPGPPVRPTTAAARTPVHQQPAAVGTPPSSGRLDTFLARQMAFMQLYKERRQAREATQLQTAPTLSRPGTSRR